MTPKTGEIRLELKFPDGEAVAIYDGKAWVVTMAPLYDWLKQRADDAAKNSTGAK